MNFDLPKVIGTAIGTFLLQFIFFPEVPLLYKIGISAGAAIFVQFMDNRYGG